MANKVKTLFFCSNCGNESPKWMGKCPSCGEWNTYVEEKVTVGKNGRQRTAGLLPSDARPQKISEIEISEEPRMRMPSEEFNRVLGGGLVAGSLTLVGGDPGIGKSTLILQNILSIRNKNILYVSGEESSMQLKLRADRIGKISDNTYILCETSLDKIMIHIEKVAPQLVVIDSIQTIASADVESAAGSVSQVRECSATLLRYAKESGVPVILIGHINKEGSIAGPKVLEHIVDTVLYFEGEKNYSYRILRGVKNRFGSTNEIGVFDMTGEGLKEVLNPSLMMISGRPKNTSGTCVACVMEGSRPILAEVQGLVCATGFGTPRRMSTGFDYNRMSMLLAVLEKRAGYFFNNMDAYINVVGGLRLDEPAADLTVAMALVSSLKDKAVGDNILAFGEVGLAGEIRAVSNCEQRVSEAYRLGFERCIIPFHNYKALPKEVKVNMDIVPVRTIRDAFSALVEE